MVSATIFIRKAFKELQTHSLFLNKWKLYNEQCHLCQRPHTAPELCFPETVMSHPQQETLQLLLDGDLWFTWIFDHRQHEVFSICRYFLINQDDIFPTFYRFLHSTYTRDDAYGYLELIYEMAKAEYDVLAWRLLDYYNTEAFTSLSCSPFGVIPFHDIIIFLASCAFHLRVFVQETPFSCLCHLAFSLSKVSIIFF